MKSCDPTVIQLLVPQLGDVEIKYYKVRLDKESILLLLRSLNQLQNNAVKMDISTQ